MSRRLCVLFVLIVLACTTRVSVAGLTTGNKFVTALVEDGSGLIWFLKGTSVNVPPSVQLSYRDKSFLSVRVGGKVYSNNNSSSLVTGRQDVDLDNGTSTKIGDTIETVWAETGFDIVQDVYPVAFEISGQIVYKIRIVNHSKAALNVQVQYLLDVDVSGNDGATALTRFNYTPNWTKYPNANHGIPWFFLGFEHPPTSANPGNIGTGYVTDDITPQPLGLMAPSTFAVVDWRLECDYAWGLVPGAPWGAGYQDNAMFYEWPATAASGSGKDTIVEIARGTYGTGEFDMCYGNLVAITFYPHRIKNDWRNRRYVPNPFNVESMIFNPSSSQDATKARASLTTSKASPLRIISPSDALALPDGTYRQVQDIGTNIVPGVGGTIAALDVAEVHWLDSTLDVVSASGDSAASLTVNCTYTGPPPPGFVTPCDMQIVIESTTTDSLPPKVRVASGGRFDSTLVATDSMMIDRGLQSISWTVTPASAAPLFPVALSWPVGGASTNSPTSFGCLKNPVSIHITQKDSTVPACLDFMVTDCNSNATYREICFSGTSPISHPDSLPPMFTRNSRSQFSPNSDTTCNAGRTNWTVVEMRKYDAGLLSVDALPGSGKNMTFHLSTSVHPGDRAADFQISVLDSTQDGSIIIVATDSVTPPHIAYDTIVYCAAQAGVEATSGSPTLPELSVSPNPSSGLFTLALTHQSGMSTVDILDILGRPVASFRMNESYEWDASRLAPGTYILRVSAGGQTLSKRIIKE